MPKVNRERTRYHAQAAGSKKKENAVLAQPQFLIGSAHQSGPQTEGMQMSKHGGPPAKMDKKAKRQLKHKKLMNKLMLPGHAVNKFNAAVTAKSRSSSSSSSFLTKPDPLLLNSVSEALPKPKDMRESMLRASMEQQCASGVSLKSSAQKREAKSFEKDQLSAVLAHPQFQADPFAAMKQHIENSIALDKSEAHSQDWRLVTHAQGQGSSAGRKRSARPR